MSATRALKLAIEDFRRTHDHDGLALVLRTTYYTNDVEMWTLRSEAHNCLGNYAAAATCATKALRLNDRHVPALLLRAHARSQGDVARMGEKLVGDEHHPVNDLNAALAIDPSCVEALATRAEILHRCGLVGDAMRDVGAALTLDPKHARALGTRGHIRCQLGDVKEGMADLNVAVQESSTDSSLLLLRAAMRLSAKEFAAAERDIETALIRDRYDPQAHLLRAAVAMARDVW